MRQKYCEYCKDWHWHGTSWIKLWHQMSLYNRIMLALMLGEIGLLIIIVLQGWGIL